MRPRKLRFVDEMQTSFVGKNTRAQRGAGAATGRQDVGARGRDRRQRAVRCGFRHGPRRGGRHHQAGAARHGPVLQHLGHHPQVRQLGANAGADVGLVHLDGIEARRPDRSWPANGAQRSGAPARWRRIRAPPRTAAPASPRQSKSVGGGFAAGIEQRLPA